MATHVLHPPLSCKKWDGPEDGHLGEPSLWGGDAATKDGPVRTVFQSQSLPRVREGDPRAAAPGSGATPQSHRHTAMGVSHLHPYPKSMTAVAGCFCLKVQGTG